ncbi:MAG: NUDIX domain-containing protein, partial [Anaerolineales bacterium]|nr:NUDIX domain-containing protein [Anaerolineales bacterium]
MRVIQLVDEAALAAWLAARGIDVDAWGRGGAKTAADLWQEVRRGECVLLETAVAPGCLRRVQLVEVIIRRGERVLLELAQELADGRRRERLIPPSEKMQPGEDTAVAAMRGLWEELHLAAADVTLLDAGAAPRRRRLDSPSYPGLPTEYL